MWGRLGGLGYILHRRRRRPSICSQKVSIRDYGARPCRMPHSDPRPRRRGPAPGTLHPEPPPPYRSQALSRWKARAAPAWNGPGRASRSQRPDFLDSLGRPNYNEKQDPATRPVGGHLILDSRSSHLFSPSPSASSYGVGSLGAQRPTSFVDFLHQSCRASSKSFPCSPRRRRPLYVPLSSLQTSFFLETGDAERGWAAQPRELEAARVVDPGPGWDYPWLHMTRPALLRKAWEPGAGSDTPGACAFLTQEAELAAQLTFLALGPLHSYRSPRTGPSPVRTHRKEFLAPLHRWPVRSV